MSSTKPQIANNESDREHAPHDSSVTQPIAVPYHGDSMPPQQSSHETVSPSPQTSNETSSPPLRRSQRQRRPPDRFKSIDYLWFGLFATASFCVLYSFIFFGWGECGIVSHPDFLFHLTLGCSLLSKTANPCSQKLIIVFK